MPNFKIPACRQAGKWQRNVKAQSTKTKTVEGLSFDIGYCFSISLNFDICNYYYSDFFSSFPWKRLPAGRQGNLGYLWASEA
jgi:hypothetical protein